MNNTRPVSADTFSVRELRVERHALKCPIRIAPDERALICERGEKVRSFAPECAEESTNGHHPCCGFGLHLIERPGTEPAPDRTGVQARHFGLVARHKVVFELRMKVLGAPDGFGIRHARTNDANAQREHVCKGRLALVRSGFQHLYTSMTDNWITVPKHHLLMAIIGSSALQFGPA